jgi:hypothetical protein
MLRLKKGMKYGLRMTNVKAQYQFFGYLNFTHFRL